MAAESIVVIVTFFVCLCVFVSLATLHHLQRLSDISREGEKQDALQKESTSVVRSGPLAAPLFSLFCVVVVLLSSSCYSCFLRVIVSTLFLPPRGLEPRHTHKHLNTHIQTRALIASSVQQQIGRQA